VCFVSEEITRTREEAKGGVVRCIRSSVVSSCEDKAGGECLGVDSPATRDAATVAAAWVDRWQWSRWPAVPLFQRAWEREVRAVGDGVTAGGPHPV
jgi:hypothetical protein